MATINISLDGTYDVSGYTVANVNVTGMKQEGIFEATFYNNTEHQYDVSQYATAHLYYLGACLKEDTDVIIDFDGNTKKIKDIEVGDLVVAYNFETDEKEMRIVTGINGHELDYLNCIELADGTIINISDGHAIYTTTGYKAVHHEQNPDVEFELSELMVGDELVGFDGQAVKITKIERITEILVPMYDFSVDSLHNYYANSFITHNTA